MELPESVRDELESRANVVGTCLGKRRINDRPTDEDAIIVLVSTKQSSEDLSDTDLIPETVEIDGEEIRTDVQEIGEPRAQAIGATTQPAEIERPDRKRRWRPAPAGVSFGHPEVTAGTLGSPPLQTNNGDRVVLTNAHIAAPLDVATTGDPVYQPGPTDGGTETDTLGTLAEFSAISENKPNTTDSALVRVDRGIAKNEILGIGQLAGIEPGTNEANRNATYTKSGRTTGVTDGDLRGYDARVKVGGYYDEPVVFEGVTMFGPMSAGGDSGSLIGIERDDGFYATHLLFAGSDQSTIGIPMATVQEEHGSLKPIARSTNQNEFDEQVHRALVNGYGPSAVSTGNGGAAGPEFVVTTPFVRLVVTVAREGELFDAVGRALTHANGTDTAPVVVYPESVHDDRLESLAGTVTLIGLSAT